MKVSRWALTVLSGAALVLVPAGSSVAEPTGTRVAEPPTRAVAAPGGAAADGRVVEGKAGAPGQIAPAPPAADAPQPPPGPPAGGLCRPGTPPNAPATTSHHGDNALLGPTDLPTASPVGPLLTGYRRFGGVTEAQWAADFLTEDRKSLRYPPSNGFVLGPDGRPVKVKQTLLPGYRLDRFGFPGGSYLAPLGTPYANRALPPLNLNTPEQSPLANYHVYCVLKPFPVDTGPIAPWFAQPGLATQFALNPAYLPEAGGALNVTWLVANGYLVEEDLGATATAPGRATVPGQARKGKSEPVRGT